MILAYSSYSKLVYDVTSGRMKYFGGKLPTGKRETGKFGQSIYKIVQNLMRYKMYLDTTMHRTSIWEV